MLTDDEKSALLKTNGHFEHLLFKPQFKVKHILKSLSTTTHSQADYNVLLLSKTLSTSKDSIVFNQVLDSLIYTLTNHKKSLYSIQNNEIKPQISQKQQIGERILYSFRYKETSLLSQIKQSIKMDMMRVSLLAVLISEAQEIFNLRTLLDTSLPKLAGLKVLIFTVGLDQKQL